MNLFPIPNLKLITLKTQLKATFKHLHKFPLKLGIEHADHIQIRQHVTWLQFSNQHQRIFLPKDIQLAFEFFYQQEDLALVQSDFP